jgi:Leucine rich repeat
MLVLAYHACLRSPCCALCWLQDIPEEFGQLKRLKTLSVSQNRIRTVPPAVLRNCSALQTLLLHGNPITAEELKGTEGFWEFERRRVMKYDKAISGGVMLGSQGLDEGVDRRVA